MSKKLIYGYLFAYCSLLKRLIIGMFNHVDAIVKFKGKRLVYRDSIEGSTIN